MIYTQEEHLIALATIPGDTKWCAGNAVNVIVTDCLYQDFLCCILGTVIMCVHVTLRSK